MYFDYMWLQLFPLRRSDVASINASAIVRSTRNPRHPQAPFLQTLIKQPPKKTKSLSHVLGNVGIYQTCFFLKHKCILTLNIF